MPAKRRKANARGTGTTWEKIRNEAGRLHWKETRGSAEGVLHDVLMSIDEDDEISESDLEERILEYTESAADGAVTYTSDVFDIIYGADMRSLDVYEEEFGSIEGTDLTDMLTKVAYYAYRTDVLHHISSIKDDYYTINEDGFVKPKKKRKKR